MAKMNLIGIEVNPSDKYTILENIKKYTSYPGSLLQIISLNPENIMTARKNPIFKKIIETSQNQICDGIGIVLAGKLFNRKFERITGVDLMRELIGLADRLSLRVLLIGGKGNLAEDIAKCYSQTYVQAKFRGVQGIKKIEKPTEIEEKTVFSIVTDYKPHFIFVAFGSPEQEIWLDRHKSKLAGIIGMGVGGAFDFTAGKVRRAPERLRVLGLEWFFRLLTEPWRWRRQLSLIEFTFLLLKQKLAA